MSALYFLKVLIAHDWHRMESGYGPHGVLADRAAKAIREEAVAEGVLMGGWGDKQGGRVKTWKRRWFTLRR